MVAFLNLTYGAGIAHVLWVNLWEAIKEGKGILFQSKGISITLSPSLMDLTHSFFYNHSFISIYSQALSSLATIDKDSSCQVLIMSSRSFLRWLEIMVQCLDVPFIPLAYGFSAFRLRKTVKHSLFILSYLSESAGDTDDLLTIFCLLIWVFYSSNSLSSCHIFFWWEKPSKNILEGEAEPFLKGPLKGDLQRTTNTNWLITHCYSSGVARDLKEVRTGRILPLHFLIC